MDPRHAHRQQRPQGRFPQHRDRHDDQRGRESLAKNSMGFTQTVKAGDEDGAIKKMFTPEFRNRLDAVISFSALSPEIIMRVGTNS